MLTFSFGTATLTRPRDDADQSAPGVTPRGAPSTGSERDRQAPQCRESSLQVGSASAQAIQVSLATNREYKLCKSEGGTSPGPVFRLALARPSRGGRMVLRPRGRTHLLGRRQPPLPSGRLVQRDVGEPALERVLPPPAQGHLDMHGSPPSPSETASKSLAPRPPHGHRRGTLERDRPYSSSSSSWSSPGAGRGCGRSSNVTAIRSMRFPSTSRTSKRIPS